MGAFEKARSEKSLQIRREKKIKAERETDRRKQLEEIEVFTRRHLKGFGGKIIRSEYQVGIGLFAYKEDDSPTNTDFSVRPIDGAGAGSRKFTVSHSLPGFHRENPEDYDAYLGFLGKYAAYAEERLKDYRRMQLSHIISNPMSWIVAVAAIAILSIAVF